MAVTLSREWEQGGPWRSIRGRCIREAKRTRYVKHGAIAAAVAAAAVVTQEVNPISSRY